MTIEEAVREELREAHHDEVKLFSAFTQALGDKELAQFIRYQLQNAAQRVIKLRGTLRGVLEGERIQKERTNSLNSNPVMSMTNLEQLTQLQHEIGYVAGELHPVAMLGLLGECGEVAEATSFMTPKEESLMQRGFFDFEEMVGRFVTAAGEIDTFKKQLRGSKPGEIHFTIKPDETDFNAELADLFYYLNAVAIGRGLTIEELAQMGYEKVIARRNATNHSQ